jgi:pyridoxal phosphate enzyme (YggS family)
MYERVAENYKKISFEIAEAKSKYRKDSDTIRFMAVTKTVPPEVVNTAVSAGIDLLGENRVQEFLSKKDFYTPAETHFIGSLQSNKVRKIIGLVTMIHSVDSIALAEEIERQSVSRDITTDVLIELNIADEDTKSGVKKAYFNTLAESIGRLSHLRLRGIMVIPPPGQSDRYFGQTQEFFHKTQSGFSGSQTLFDTLSMGMSGDIKAAVKYGSNILRIGSALFGAREYQK